MGIYLDHNATSPMYPEVAEVVTRVSRECFGNPSSVHRFGQRALATIEEARDRIAGFIGARAAEIVFVSGGTEANNMALSGLLAGRRRGNLHLIVSAIEHHSVLRAAEWLERDRGVAVTRVAPRRDGVIDPGDIDAAVRPDTALIAVMLVNNEIGTIQPVRDIALRARNRGIAVHADCVQAAGKIPVDVRDLGVTTASFAAHKMRGPKGVGALFVRESTIEPLLWGGSQERDRRAGTENVGGIAGFGEACRIAGARMDEANDRCRFLRDRFESIVAGEGAVVFGKDAPRVSNTCFFGFPGIAGEKLLIALDLAGIAVSTGSACSSGIIEPSHVLLACGYEPALCKAAIRVSCGSENTVEEIDATAAAIRAIVAARSPRNGGRP